MSQQLIEMVSASRGQIEKALPAHVKAERIQRVALTAIRMNRQLGECTPESFLGALMTAAQLGLEVNTPLGHAYLIPYKRECTFQLGYKGLLDLAYRTGNYNAIDAHVVYEEDDFDFQLGLNADLTHKPARIRKKSNDPIYYYAYYKLKSGGSAFRVWSHGDITEHAKKYSPSFGKSSSPWKTNFASMAKKTVLKDLLKYAPLSPEDRQHFETIERDNSVIKFEPKEGILNVEHKAVAEIQSESSKDDAQSAEDEAAVKELE